MQLDILNEFCDATALPIVGATDSVLVGNVIDLGKTANFPGNTDGLYLEIEVDTDVTSAGAATVQFELASDSTANLATSRTTHYQSAAIGKATLVAGYRLVIPLPRGTYERYLGIWVTVATAALTAGKINAFLTKNPRSWMALPDGL